MKKTITQLRKQEANARAEIQRLEEIEIEKKQKPRLRAMVGECYAYRNNSYSVPKKKSDYWDVFRKILEYVDTPARGFHFIYEEFSIDKEGRVGLEINETAPYLNKEWWNTNPFRGWEKITEAEYKKERAHLSSELVNYTKLKKRLDEDY